MTAVLVTRSKIDRQINFSSSRVRRLANAFLLYAQLPINYSQSVCPYAPLSLHDISRIETHESIHYITIIVNQILDIINDKMATSRQFNGRIIAN